MILWADGFDHYGTSTTGANNMLLGAYAELLNASPSTTQKRTGPNSLSLSTNQGKLRRIFGGPIQTTGLAGGFWIDSLPIVNNNCTPFQWRDSANAVQVSIVIQTTGTVAAYRAAGSTIFSVLLGTSTTTVPTAAWNHIEAKVKIDGSTGSVEVRLNGVTILNLSGINTKNATAPAANENSASQMTTMFQGNFGGGVMYLDDLVCWNTSGSLNNDFIGDQKVFTDMPTGDTADVAWTPDTGSNRWSRIDEIPPDADTSYDASSTAGDKMGVTFPALDALVGSVAAVIFIDMTKKTDAGVCSVQKAVQSNGSTQVGADNPITTAYTYRLDVFEVDPDTAAPWLPAAAGSAALRIERTA